MHPSNSADIAKLRDALLFGHVDTNLSVQWGAERRLNVSDGSVHSVFMDPEHRSSVQSVGLVFSSNRQRVRLLDSPPRHPAKANGAGRSETSTHRCRNRGDRPTANAHLQRCFIQKCLLLPATRWVVTVSSKDGCTGREGVYRGLIRWDQFTCPADPFDRIRPKSYGQAPYK